MKVKLTMATKLPRKMRIYRVRLLRRQVSYHTQYAALTGVYNNSGDNNEKDQFSYIYQNNSNPKVQ